MPHIGSILSNLVELVNERLFYRTEVRSSFDLIKALYKTKRFPEEEKRYVITNKPKCP
jgi:hypothetical protein